MNNIQKKHAEDLTKLNNIILQQGEISLTKIKAIEEKYRTVRKINIALEVCFVFFCLNEEKY